MNERISFVQAQRRLALVWFLLSLLAFSVVLFLTIAGSFGRQSEKAWSWFLPNVIPTLTLILTALVAEGRQPGSEATVERFTYRLTMALSIGYLILVLLALLLLPFARWLADMTRIELLGSSNLWLAPIQALVGIALGLFFVSRERT